MSAKRVAARQRRRRLQASRWELVHAAGCVYDTCATVSIAREGGFELERGTRVPRSLRLVYGLAVSTDA